MNGGASGKDSVLLAYRYLRPGYKLGVAAQRFAEAGVLQALVDSMRLATVVAEDGQMMTEMSLAVRNNGRQYLEVELPRDATVWSAFVCGQPVRPSKQGTKLLLPLERTGADDAPLPVEITYVGRERFPKTRGAVALASPTLDVPLKNARWDLYLPPDYEYAKFAGSMSHEEAEVAPVREVFSLGEYNSREAANKEARMNESKLAISNLKSLVSSSGGQQAGENFEQLKKVGKDARDDESKKEVAQLEREFRRQAGSNLINAQRAYSMENSFKLELSDQRVGANLPAQQEAQQQMLNYDAEAAEQQWAKLQQAQEVTVATVAPLRVNLPTHGQRHSFTQVLQTELNKSLTIEFSAKNLKETPWYRSAAWFAGVFGVLWIFSAIVATRRNSA
ncbi:MAG: hypothetical protein HY300_19040 [Verrucomicrobia bacterium]|nr:hypothetical protein [Verrucomicrobiota bacterium]